MQQHKYYVVFNSHDRPIELVRVHPDTGLSITIAPYRYTGHVKKSELFINGNPISDTEYCFQLIHAGDASAPVIGEYIDIIEKGILRQQRRAAPRRPYGVTNARDRVISLLNQGCSVRKAARQCGVPKSTVGRWKLAV